MKLLQITRRFSGGKTFNESNSLINLANPKSQSLTTP